MTQTAISYPINVEPSVSTERSRTVWARLESIYEVDTSGKRVVAMEGLRGMAMLMVFLCHYKIVILSRLSPNYDSTLFRWMVQMGTLGLDLFFLLSGMLIYRAALRRNLKLGSFLARRFQRIYPTFLVAFGIYFVTSVLLHQGDQRVPGTLGAAASYVTYNLLLLPGLADIRPLIPAAWSLSYELCFYISIPIIVLLLRVSYWPRLQRCMLWASILVAQLLYVLLLPQRLPAYRYQDNSFLRFGMFLTGMLVYEFFDSARGPAWLTTKRQILLSLTGTAAAVTYGWFLFRNVNILHPPMVNSVIRSLLVPIIFASLALTTLGERGLWRNMFNNAWLRWTGNISYSLYLIHGMVLNTFIAILLHISVVKAYPAVSAVILLPISFVVTFLVSTLLFMAVEKPLSLQPSRSKRNQPARRESPLVLNTEETVKGAAAGSAVS